MVERSAQNFATTLIEARKGSRKAWESLYKTFAPSVLGYLRSQRTSAAEDVLGEVWLQVVRDLDAFSGNKKAFQSWLFTIARHRVIDAHRSEQRRPEHPNRSVPERAHEDLSMQRLESDAGTLLVSMLEGLTDTQREVLYLRNVLDMSYKQIARVTGGTVAAAKMAHSRAIRAASKSIAGSDFDD